MSRRLQVVGIRAEFWARDTGADRETVLFGPDYFTPTSLTPATMARMMSTSGADDGAVDFWPEVGGQTEVRDADTGETLWVYRGGRRFSPAALAEAEARLAAPKLPAPPPPPPPATPAALAAAVAEMGKVIGGFILVERARGHVVSVEGFREFAMRLGTEAGADAAIESAADWLAAHDTLRDAGNGCGCYPPCKIPAARP